MIGVLIADDEPLIVAGIRTVLESAGDLKIVAQASDGKDAVAAAARHRVDVALLDINMPVLDGLATLKKLRQQSPTTRIVMLTAFGTEPHVQRALRDGAAGFVLKNCAPDELIRAVRAAHAGDTFLSPAVTRMVLGMVDPTEADRREHALQQLTMLTPRESEILQLVARGLSNADSWSPEGSPTPRSAAGCT